MTLLSAIMLLLLVIDPLGNIPVFLVALRHVPASRRKRVILRELVIAFCLLTAFLFLGPNILRLLNISGPSLSIAGGFILLLIAVKMIFPTMEERNDKAPRHEPFIVPLAVPYLAGPSAMATVMLIMSREPQRWMEWCLALVVAWLVTGGVLLVSDELEKVIGDRALTAVERLMGMILVAVSVEMALNGIVLFVSQHRTP